MPKMTTENPNTGETITQTPEEMAAETVKSEVFMVELSGSALEALNWQFAREYRDLLPVIGSAKIGPMREKYVADFISKQIKQVANAGYNSVLARVENLGPKDVKALPKHWK